MFQIKFVERIKHTFYVPELFSRDRTVYEITSKNMVEHARSQILRMRVACWISKAKRAQAHPRAHAPTPTSTHTHVRTHAH